MSLRIGHVLSFRPFGGLPFGLDRFLLAKNQWETTQMRLDQYSWPQNEHAGHFSHAVKAVFPKIMVGKYVFVSLGSTSQFFPGILLSRKPSKTLGKWMAFEKNDG